MAERNTRITEVVDALAEVAEATLMAARQYQVAQMQVVTNELQTQLDVLTQLLVFPQMLTTLQLLSQAILLVMTNCFWVLLRTMRFYPL